MTENKTNLKVDALNMQIRDSVTAFADKLLTALGDNLQSITVVGSSLTEDFRPGQSDINTVLVLGEQTLASLNAVASLAKPMSRKKISPPLLMTQSYIEQSRDVFGIEFLDFQLAHETVMGDDPFTCLEFDKKTYEFNASVSSKPCLSGSGRATSPRRQIRNSSVTFSSRRQEVWRRYCGRCCG